MESHSPIAFTEWHLLYQLAGTITANSQCWQLKIKMKVAIIVWPVKLSRGAEECRAGKVLPAHGRLSSFIRGWSWQLMGSEWNLPWDVFALLPHIPYPLLSSALFSCCLSFFQVLQVLLIFPNNYWLLNSMDSAKCSKCFPILTATLEGSEWLNDFQGHKLRRG